MKRTAILVTLAVSGVLGGFANADAAPGIAPASAAAVDAGAAGSAPSPAKIDEARKRLSRGRQLYGEGEYKAAREQLASAYELAPTYKLLYDIAQCDRQLGDYVEAIRHLEKHLRDDGGAIDAARRQEVEKELASLRAQVGHLTVKVNVPDAELLVDDEPAGKLTAEPVLLNPARHKIWVTKPGYYPESKEVVAEASQNIELMVDLRPVPTPRHSLSARITGSPIGRVALIVVPLLIAAAAVARRTRRGSAAASRTPSNVDTTPAPGGVEAEINEVQPAPEHAVAIIYDEDAAGEGPRLSTPMVLESAVKHDIGKVKPTNQDSYLLKAEQGVFAIADGIGGNAGGDVASATAVRAIEECFDGGDLKVGRLTHLPREAGELAIAVYAANHAIRRKQAADWNISDMGTTCVAARFSRDAQRLYVAHIGDSRAYRLRAGKIEQMTTDHTMAELGLVGPRANHLSRALGSDPCPKIDVLFARPVAGDVYLLCSDGLTKMMTVEQLSRVLHEAGSADAAVASLVELANAQGGQDNITVVVIRVLRT